MSIDHLQPDSLSLSPFRLLKPSHRTRPEQIVGLSIFLLVSFGFEFINRSIALFSLPAEWFQSLVFAPWVFKSWPYTPLWAGYHLLLSLAMWTLWRRFSLRTLKLELSVFLAQFAFQTAWCSSFFFLQETLLALVVLLLLLCNTLLLALLFWKKEKFSGQLLVPPFFWVFYIMGINMAICILNP